MRRGAEEDGGGHWDECHEHKGWGDRSWKTPRLGVLLSLFPFLSIPVLRISALRGLAQAVCRTGSQIVHVLLSATLH